MKRRQQGQRIVWLVRTLAAVGLIAGVITLGTMGWMLAQVRDERANTVVELRRLNRAVAELRALESGAEKETTVDETDTQTATPKALSELVRYIRSELDDRQDRSVRGSLIRLDSQVLALVDFARRAGAWHARYAEVSQDLREQRTIGRLRQLITDLRQATSSLEGRHRLDDAIRYRRWRLARGDAAAQQAQAILIEQGRWQSQDLTDLNAQLADLMQFTEMLGGEEQLDRLNDLKDNQLTPLLERLSHSVAMLDLDQDSATPPKSQAIEEIKVAFFGAGSGSHDPHEGIPLHQGGLFHLRRDAIELRRDREKLKKEQTDLFDAIETATMEFGQSAQIRTTFLAQEIEANLAVAWRRSLILGGVCAALFLWLASLIARGVKRQVNALETRTMELTREIAERDKAKQDLRQLRQHQEVIFNSISEGIYLIDCEGRVIFANPAAARLVGWDISELLGKPAHATMHHTRADGTPYPKSECQINQRLQSAGARRVSDEVFWRKDGTSFPVEYTTTPMRESLGQITGAVIVVTDITERRRAEAEMQLTNRQLIEISRKAGMAEVATGILHNVGNVLNSVNVSASVMSDLLRKSCVSKLGVAVKMLTEHAADLADYLARDGRGSNLTAFLAQLANHLNGETGAMTGEMAALSRNLDHIKEIVSTQQAYAGSAGFIECVDVRQLFEDALRIHAAALARLDIVVVREFADAPPIQADKHKLMQILVNLISNAKHAMAASPGKTLTLKVEAAGGGVLRVSVRDTGYGIAAENMTRIFAHGFTTKKEGHGFGLHSSALAAKEMKGSLRVHSDGVGRGAVFILDLPPAVREALAA